MSDLPGVRKYVQTEETRFRAAVSEALAQKLGSSINFINSFQKYVKQWFINGQYNALSIPFLGIDGMTYVPDNATITNAFMFHRAAGTGGSTSLDIKTATTPGGTFTSIFSTQPSINYAAGNFAFCFTGSSFLNTTAPVLSVTSLNANTVLRCDITSAQSGNTAKGCGLILFMQPR